MNIHTVNDIDDCVRAAVTAFRQYMEDKEKSPAALETELKSLFEKSHGFGVEHAEQAATEDGENKAYGLSLDALKEIE